VGSALQIVRREQGDVGILELSGRLERSLEPALLQALEGLSGRGISRVVLDCAGLVFLGSGGFSAGSWRARRGVSFTLQSAPPPGRSGGR